MVCLENMDWRYFVMTNYEWIKQAPKEDIALLIYSAILPYLDDYTEEEKVEVYKEYKRWIEE